MSNTLQKDKKHNWIFTILCFIAMAAVNIALWHNLQFVTHQWIFFSGMAISAAGSLGFGISTIANALKGGSEGGVFVGCIGCTVLNIIWAIAFLNHV